MEQKDEKKPNLKEEATRVINEANKIDATITMVNNGSSTSAFIGGSTVDLLVMLRTSMKANPAFKSLLELAVISDLDS
jgi:hypothetical protein